MTFKGIRALIWTLAVVLLLSVVGIAGDLQATEHVVIDIEEAQRLAFEATSIDLDEIHKLKVTRDVDDERAYYKVEFEASSGDYEVEIDQQTGQLIKSRIAYQYVDENRLIVGKSITEAKQIAYDAAALDSLLSIYELEVKLDLDDEFSYYEIVFKTDQHDYKFKIHADSGDILHRDLDRDYEKYQLKPELSIDQAIEIAFEAAGLESSRSVYELEAELDKDKGNYYYEVEFETYTGDFEFDIDASTGQILKHDVDYYHDDDDDDDDFSRHRMVMLSLEAAKQIAYDDASFVEQEFVYELEIEFDDDDDMNYYEVEFKTLVAEYKYEIHADTGEILKRDIDYKDDEHTDYDDTDYDDDDMAFETSGLTYDQAMQRAINEARISSKDIYELKIQRDDNGYQYYKIEIKTYRGQFKYEMRTSDGYIIMRDVDYDDDDDRYLVNVSIDQAIRTAVQDAGITAHAVYEIDAKLDEDDGYLYYEIQIKTMQRDYKFEVFADNGRIKMRDHD